MLTLHSLLLVIHGFCRSPSQTRSKLRSPTRFCDSILEIFLLYNVCGVGEVRGKVRSYQNCTQYLRQVNIAHLHRGTFTLSVLFSIPPQMSPGTHFTDNYTAIFTELL